MVEEMAGCLLHDDKTHACPLDRRGRRRWGWLARVALAASTLLVGASSASADPRTEFFVKQLKTSDDFKVRTQAALALGASGDADAIAPLCGALSDANSAVKVAAAAALGKLGKAEGTPCLKTAKAKEKDQSVLTTIEQSLAKLPSPEEAVIGASTKFYVAIQVTNKTTRSDGDIEKVVRTAAAGKLQGAAGYAVAPKSETAAKSGEICRGKKLKGLLLLTSVEAPVYANGKVSISFNTTIWTYPDKSLKATINGKRSTDAQGSPDIEGENLLIQAASEDAATKLIAAAAKL
jgi:hypothetical protein